MQEAQPALATAAPPVAPEPAQAEQPIVPPPGANPSMADVPGTDWQSQAARFSS